MPRRVPESAMISAILLLTLAPGDVTFMGVGGIDLRGTLLVPKAAKPAPAVLLLPGSGPTDRNGNQPPAITTNLLKDIAEHLEKQGIASLRFDKRAAHVYSAVWPKSLSAMDEFFKWENFAGDAKAALAFLGKQPGVDAKRLVVVGHSEGGLIAAQIAADTAGKPSAPAALVLMGTAGRRLDIVIDEQVKASLNRSGLSVEAQKPYLDYMAKAIASLKATATVPPNPPAGMAGLFNASAAKLLQSYFTLEPTQLLAKFRGPVLILQGEKDVQISKDRDTPLLERALKPRGKVEVVIIPSASHNFKKVNDAQKEMGFSGPVVAPTLAKLATFVKSLP